ncbi:hypothetical protein [Fluviicola sp.]|jgi:hypothetical protein|uniref:hypothetical protein n=1 Tax=Fluviicola sp. TaxID=1917219 RepID=UPI002821909E|nr:hypothetical protein [Fluviicola sp.]MDR0803230.1 hypothetical protein [Fluviicola sp.]
MIGIRIIPLLLVCALLAGGCHKENGKHKYELRLLFDSGDVFLNTGVIKEKSRDNKYRGFYVDVFTNGLHFLKVKDNQLVCSDEVTFLTNKPANFAGGMAGTFKGDIYLEGTYTQKGRAYTVDDGYFEFIWRNMTTGQPMSSIVYKGKWTLKRK